jgi:hypothetical protein
MPDPIQNPYSDSLEALYDASGEVETIINDGTPTPAQSTLLNFLQGPLKTAIQTAAQADGVVEPGEQP